MKKIILSALLALSAFAAFLPMAHAGDGCKCSPCQCENCQCGK